MLLRKQDRRLESRPNMRGGNGTAEILHTFEEMPPHARLVSTITLPAGASIGEHKHEGEAEFFVFLSGSAKLLDDGEAITARAGDVMLTPSGHTHAVENAGDEPLVFQAIIVKE